MDKVALVCKHCGGTEFHTPVRWSSGYKVGLRYQCKACAKERAVATGTDRVRYLVHREMLAWKKRHPEAYRDLSESLAKEDIEFESCKEV